MKIAAAKTQIALDFAAPITAEWLTAAGFERATYHGHLSDNFRLPIGHRRPAESRHVTDSDSLCLELGSGAAGGNLGAWYLWVVDADRDRSIFVRFVRTVGEVTTLFAALTGAEWRA